jgi:hypothetical protein
MDAASQTAVTANSSVFPRAQRARGINDQKALLIIARLIVEKSSYHQQSPDQKFVADE